jgi:hypothetical protein
MASSNHGLDHGESCAVMVALRDVGTFGSPFTCCRRLDHRTTSCRLLRSQGSPAVGDVAACTRYVLLALKNVLGVVLLIAGLIMLIAPGQGLLTIMIGLTLIDFPGKYRLESWFVTRPAVWKSVNWLRRRAGRAEIQRPPI